VIKISVQADISGALRKLNVTAEQARKAIPRALNKVATTARAEAAREIKQAGYGLKVGAIKKAIKTIRATKHDLTAIVRASGSPIPLIEYGARQTRKGVTVSVLRGRKLIPGGFIATMPTGHRGVFVHKGEVNRWVMRNGKRVRSRLPIRELFGPSIPQAFVNNTVQAALKGAIKARFPVVLMQELRAVGLGK
jgi:hypothetical protein